MFLSISRVVRIFGEYSFIIVFTSDSLLFLGFSFPSSPYRAVGPELAKEESPMECKCYTNRNSLMIFPITEALADCC